MYSWAAVIIILLSFAVFYAVLVGLHSLRDQSTNINFRGRIYGSVTAVTTPPAIISMLVGGFLAEIYGVEHVLFGAGILAMLSLIIILRRDQTHLFDAVDAVKAAYQLEWVNGDREYKTAMRFLRRFP